MHVGLSDSQIGLCLFMFGCFGLLGLLFSPKLISRFSSRMVLCVNAVLCFLGLLGIGFAQTVPQIFVAFGICGFSVSLLDGAMNTQGVLYEKASKRPTLNLFHAFYSLGAVFASAVGLCAPRLPSEAGINFFVRFSRVRGADSSSQRLSPFGPCSFNLGLDGFKEASSSCGCDDLRGLFSARLRV